MVYLHEHHKDTGVQSPCLLQQYLSITCNLSSPKALKVFCSEMISHPLSVIGQTAVNEAIELIGI